MNDDLNPNTQNETLNTDPVVKKKNILHNNKKLIAFVMLIGILVGWFYIYYIKVLNKTSIVNEIKHIADNTFANDVIPDETIMRFLPNIMKGDTPEEHNNVIDSQSNNLQVQYILIVKLLLDNIRENKDYEPILDLLIILNNNKNITKLLYTLRPFAYQPALSNLELLSKFNNEIYRLAYLNYLSQDRSINGIISHMFHWLIFIKNRNVINPNDIRYKLNAIANNLSKNNVEEALNIANSLDKINDYRVNDWIDSLNQKVAINKIRIALENELNQYMNKR